ncbi:Zn-ribbon domain-containing OB-fold protein [Cupriavidus consociatus]|uniref:Zn-ribbon domain-containing OB-fold protein n=1 Tax=Cupriavidus consociatus TaxID=2821357 RepID=UPI001AEB23F8|nr:Zn-ribbon domain-containing OB-fold protein [Cupriavidus sp. LEh21]MBP0624374.1 Zn-ribbon domain-containing OB-fold protein [Cupriavidus sp. LEh25]MDK2661089.1 Zn-ribbon domain-containing OB-fold protein [Cupriavidus sp. LEh21]
MQAALPKPVANADSQVYWDAARERRLVIRRCKACGELHFMPRYLCPSCWSDDLEWIDAAGTGRVHSFSVIRRASDPAFASRVPYVIALIELDEGPRMMANILGENALAVGVGDAVRVTFEDRGDGALIPQFERISESGA